MVRKATWYRRALDEAELQMRCLQRSLGCEIAERIQAEKSASIAKQRLDEAERRASEAEWKMAEWMVAADSAKSRAARNRTRVENLHAVAVDFAHKFSEAMKSV
jgi:hypothetical protein